MSNKDLIVELKGFPGGVVRFTHAPTPHTVIISVDSPRSGIMTFEIHEEAASVIEKWFHQTAKQNPSS
jgi:hypothetical protein